jgi:hypothetical protein
MLCLNSEAKNSKKITSAGNVLSNTFIKENWRKQTTFLLEEQCGAED